MMISLARLGDGVAVEVLDPLAEAQVVAHHQAGEQAGAGALRRMGVRVEVAGAHLRIVHVGAGARGGAHRLERLGEIEVARLARRFQAQPQPAHRLVRVGDQRAGHPHREVEARLVERAVVRIAVVVEQVDAAAEGDAAVDARRACGAGAASAAASARASRAPGCRRAIARRPPSSAPAIRPGTSPVPKPSTTTRTRTPRARRALQRLGDRERRAGELEDVGLEQDLGAGGVDRLRPGPRTAPRRPSAGRSHAPAASARLAEGSRSHRAIARLAHALVSSSSATSGR